MCEDTNAPFACAAFRYTEIPLPAPANIVLYSEVVARPRKIDKKVPLSFRADPRTARRLERFATAIGASLSEAVDVAVREFLDSDLVGRVTAERAAESAAARREIEAEASAVAALGALPRGSLWLLESHLGGLTYRDMVRGTSVSAAQAREIVRRARSELGDHYPVVLSKPELIRRIKHARPG